MRSSLLPIGVATLVLVGGGFPGAPSTKVLGPSAALAATIEHRVEFRYFFDELKPYGRWVRHPRYGWIWKPSVSSDWRPYTVGGWRHTQTYGWVWASSEPFGSIVYHYGWWDHDKRGHWFWVPGYAWAPAWVVWKSGPTHVGWAPLPPERVWGRSWSVAFSISWRADYDPTPESWCFIETRWITAPSVINVVVPPQQNVTYIDNSVTIYNTTVVNQTIVNQGIDVKVLQHEHGVTVHDSEVAVVSDSATTPGVETAPATAASSEAPLKIVQPFGGELDSKDAIVSASPADAVSDAELQAANAAETQTTATEATEPDPKSPAAESPSPKQSAAVPEERTEVPDADASAADKKDDAKADETPAAAPNVDEKSGPATANAQPEPPAAEEDAPAAAAHQQASDQSSSAEAAEKETPTEQPGDGGNQADAEEAGAAPPAEQPSE